MRGSFLGDGSGVLVLALTQSGGGVWVLPPPLRRAISALLLKQIEEQGYHLLLLCDKEEKFFFAERSQVCHKLDLYETYFLNDSHNPSKVTRLLQ